MIAARASRQFRVPGRFSRKLEAAVAIGDRQVLTLHSCHHTDQTRLCATTMLSTTRMLRVARTSRVLAAAPPAAAANSGSNHLPRAQRLRTSTGITGVPVHPSPLPTLVGMYQATLKLLEAIPDGSVYRQATEALTNQRLAIVEKHLASATQQASASKVEHADEKAIEAAEEEIDDGLIEEVINQAQHEQRLAGKMIEWKRCVRPRSSPAQPTGRDRLTHLLFSCQQPRASRSPCAKRTVDLL